MLFVAPFDGSRVVVSYDRGVTVVNADKSQGTGTPLAHAGGQGAAYAASWNAIFASGEL